MINRDVMLDTLKSMLAGWEARYAELPYPQDHPSLGKLIEKGRALIQELEVEKD